MELVTVYRPARELKLKNFADLEGLYVWARYTRKREANKGGNAG